LHGAVIIEDVITHFGNAKDRFAPSLALIPREPHHGTTVGEGILPQIEQRNLTSLQPQERNGHYVKAAFLLHDDGVFVRPGFAFVARSPGREMPRRMVAAAAGEVAVNQENSAILQFDKIALAVAGIARSRRQEWNLLHAFDDLRPVGWILSVQCGRKTESHQDRQEQHVPKVGDADRE
jgi:hypothetical protein